MKNKMFIALTVLVLLVGFAQIVHGRLAVGNLNLVEIHLPGTEKGKKFGAVSFTDLREKDLRLKGTPGEFKPTIFTVPLSESTRITAQGKDGDVKITLKDLRPGVVGTHIAIDRTTNARTLVYIYVIDRSKGK